ncbi:hypothetical protein NE237_007321 [Protea cynaroides]|uniref:RING-CH-type domain-containing protein n=1 Tax=Protea cynaroides TaxID=273540 RepID=A0A9Q0KP63_9MAGN|nr:hypothetical protein NE237_007321 [Protea cynaroides]
MLVDTDMEKDDRYVCPYSCSRSSSQPEPRRCIVYKERGKSFLSVEESEPLVIFLECYLKMGDHFVLLMDRLLTESTLEAAIGNRNMSLQTSLSAVEATTQEISSHSLDFNDGSSPMKLVECRICQDDDYDSNMETPCSCCGSLKYAHRRCIQRWCDEKGDTICEICNQQFKPGYTAPPKLFRYGGIPMNFRGNWEISRRDLRNPQFIAMVATDRNFLDPDHNEYSAATSKTLLCCRIVAIIFMVVLVLRHSLPNIVTGTGEYSVPLLILLILRTAGILLPIYIMMRAVTALHRRRQQQEYMSTTESDEEDELA